MSVPSQLYRPNLALLTDLYQLTMACAAFHSGIHEREAVFHLTFRKAPFKGGYAVACGLEHAVDLIRNLRFGPEDLDYLASLQDPAGGTLFPKGFLDYLARMPVALELDAIPEGTLVFPHEPLLRVQGAIIPCMLLETPLLALINFQTLIATKASRICRAAQGQPVLEFGLRRAQGLDGALSATRAAYVGGVAATSNVLAGRLYGIPVRGTHAHSWVMLFDDEPAAFAAYARALPDNCVFLVDTYDTLEGVRHAIEAGRALKAQGHELYGIRLDSGDLAYLSLQARKLLDDAGFKATQILATNDLDEHVIESLKQQGAAIDVWGVGTRLATAHDDPALGGVYKLAAVRERGGPWKRRVKLSEQLVKISTPGVLQVRRFTGEGGAFVADAVYDVSSPAPEQWTLVDPLDPLRRRALDAALPHEDLLVPVLRAGEVVRPSPPLAQLRERTRAQLARLHPGVTRFLNPHQYPVGLESSLHERRSALVLQARGGAR
jgi:nicotinate phosphoribosyltransferase